MSNKKLKAFTLIEIIVSLSIASIVMLLASYGFNTIVRMGNGMRSGLSNSESNYFLLADVERQFNMEDEVVAQFNDLTFQNVSFEFGVEMTFRKQSGRTDTLNPLILSPQLNLAIVNQDANVQLSDRLSFTVGEQSYDLMRQSSLAENINQIIRNGEN